MTTLTERMKAIAAKTEKPGIITVHKINDQLKTLHPDGIFKEKNADISGHRIFHTVHGSTNPEIHKHARALLKQHNYKKGERKPGGQSVEHTYHSTLLPKGAGNNIHYYEHPAQVHPKTGETYYSGGFRVE